MSGAGRVSEENGPRSRLNMALSLVKRKSIVPDVVSPGDSGIISARMCG